MRIPRHKSQLTPLGAVVRGALAGAAGTLAMDLVWYRRYRRGGGESKFGDWEFSSGLESYEKAPAPAQVGKRIVQGVLQTELKPETAAFMNNFMHWATGVAWGAMHGILVGSTSENRVSYGLATGTGAWVASYAVLASARLYKPMWEYSATTLAKDLSAHLVFGLATAATFRALSCRLGRG